MSRQADFKKMLPELKGKRVRINNGQFTGIVDKIEFSSLWFTEVVFQDGDARQEWGIRFTQLSKLEIIGQ